MNRISAYLIAFGLLYFTNCEQEAKKLPRNLREGIWRAVLHLPENDMPFNFRIEKTANQQLNTMYLLNGEESIPIEQLTFKDDSVWIRMHIFDTQIAAHISDGQLTGEWRKFGYKKGGYAIPLTAQWNDSSRFQLSQAPTSADISGTWQVSFYDEENIPEQSVGIFKVEENSSLTGTFLTTTGDYRYLQGNISGEQFLLSCFDGEHAFLFKASIVNADSLANGVFYSGKHWKQTWSAHRNERAALPDPNTLTYLKEGYERLSFSFPNLDSNMVSLANARYQNKVTIVKLLGSWCPNCMDETAFLAPFYKKYHSQGLEIIGLAYERTTEFAKAKKRLEILKKRFDIQYELLYAGTNKKAEATKTLPMLNRIVAFPTTIFIDKQGIVRKIHTGFSGPGTGKYYQQTIEEITLFTEKLLSE